MPGLVAALACEDEALRGIALEALGRLGDPRVAPELAPLLHHADPGVARAAASALAELSRRSAPRPRLEARPAMAQEDFRRLRDLVHEHCGLTFGDDARLLFENRLAPRLRLVGVPGFAAYHGFLTTGPGGRAELEAAVEALTVHETQFYREPHQLRAFSEEILPALARENGRERRLRIWSAGCSTGEEVYTIAILLARSELFEGWNVQVLGSDIARRVLAVAEAGAYGPHAFRTAEAEALRPWFRAEAGKWHVRDVVRALVRFVPMNLLDEGATRLAPAVDVIFCRNVMIYFDLAARRRLASTFHDKLREGGYLMLGNAESLLHITADFELVHLRHDLVYRQAMASLA